MNFNQWSGYIIGAGMTVFVVANAVWIGTETTRYKLKKELGID